MLKLLFIPLAALTIWVSLFSSALAVTEPFFKLEQLQELGFQEYETINPNSLFYPLKQISEKLSLVLMTDQSEKEQFYLDQLDKRFNELVFIINQQKLGFLDETIGRYNSAVGSLKALSPTSLDQNKLKTKITILEALRDRYHSGTGHWVNIQQTIDTTNSLL